MKKICCFTGHSKLYGEDFLWNALLEELEKGIITEQMEEFWVGNYGQFDGMAARAVRKLKEKYLNA